MVETLIDFYSTHYNIGIIGGIALLISVWRLSRKDAKGFLTFLCLFLVYNIVVFKKTERNPDWYVDVEAKFKGFDPVNELWNEKQDKKPDPTAH